MGSLQFFLDKERHNSSHCGRISQLKPYVSTRVLLDGISDAVIGSFP